MDKEITLSIERQQRALKAMHAAKSPVFKHFWFNVFGKILLPIKYGMIGTTELPKHLSLSTLLGKP